MYTYTEYIHVYTYRQAYINNQSQKLTAVENFLKCETFFSKKSESLLRPVRFANDSNNVPSYLMLTI